MKRLLITLIASACVAGHALAEDGHAALVKSVTGKVRVMRKNGGVELTTGMLLYASDRLVSERGASAGLAFRDGTLLTVGPAAEVELQNYVFEPATAKYAFSVYLAKGSAVYESGKIGKIDPSAVRVDTPTATVGVRGTRFIVQAEE